MHLMTVFAPSRGHRQYQTGRVHAFVADLTCDDLTAAVPPASIEMCTLVFVLSAIAPSQMQQACLQPWLRTPWWQVSASVLAAARVHVDTWQLQTCGRQKTMCGTCRRSATLHTPSCPAAGRSSSGTMLKETSHLHASTRCLVPRVSIFMRCIEIDLRTLANMCDFVKRNGLACCTGGQGPTAGAWCLLPQRWNPHVLLQQRELLHITWCIRLSPCDGHRRTISAMSCWQLPLGHLQSCCRCLECRC